MVFSDLPVILEIPGIEISIVLEPSRKVKVFSPFRVTYRTYLPSHLVYIRDFLFMQDRAKYFYRPLQSTRYPGLRPASPLGNFRLCETFPVVQVNHLGILRRKGKWSRLSRPFFARNKLAFGESDLRGRPQPPPSHSGP
jgi:hypothetical protein